MDTMTRDDTILWINHAISYFKKINKTQKDMCRIFGINESRLSEMKVGQGKISPSLLNKIKEHCGAPRQNPGRYLEAELYKSLDSFIESFPSVTCNRAGMALLKLLNDSKFYSNLLSNLSLSDIYKSNGKELLENNLNELLASAEFEAVYDKLTQLLDTNTQYDPRNDLFARDLAGLEVGQMVIYDCSAFKVLYLIAKCLIPLPGFKLGLHNKFLIQPISPNLPMVITGKRVLVLEAAKLEKFEEIVRTDELAKLQALLRLECHSLSRSKPKEYVFDEWHDGRCEVYLSENMNYHFLIHLSESQISVGTYSKEADPSDDDYYGFPKPGDRLIVIENVNVLHLFEQIELIRNWFGLTDGDHYILSDDCHYELREKIAKAGGYIPGAKVLL